MSLRRHAILMAVLPAPAAAGKVVPTTVNVRGPEGQPTDQGGAGTPGLDIDFGGSAPAISSLAVTKANAPLVAYLTGDSTRESAFHHNRADATVRATVGFAANEKPVTLHGYAPTATGGTAGTVHHAPATHLFTVTVTPGADHNAVIVLTR